MPHQVGPGRARRCRTRQERIHPGASDKAVRDIRTKAKALVVTDVTGEEYNERRNYVFPTFVTTAHAHRHCRVIIAAIFAAAMSSIAAELNSLATSTVIDVYRRLLKPTAADAHYAVSKWATLFWGLAACGVATVAVQPGSLIGPSTGSVLSSTAPFSAYSSSRLASIAPTVTVLQRAPRWNRRRVRVRVASEHQERLVPVAQPARRHHRGHRRPVGQPDERSRPPPPRLRWASSRPGRHDPPAGARGDPRRGRARGAAGPRRVRASATISSSPAARSSTAPAGADSSRTWRSRTAGSRRSGGFRDRRRRRRSTVGADCVARIRGRPHARQTSSIGPPPPTSSAWASPRSSRATAAAPRSTSGRRCPR